MNFSNLYINEGKDKIVEVDFCIFISSCLKVMIPCYIVDMGWFLEKKHGPIGEHYHHVWISIMDVSEF